MTITRDNVDKLCRLCLGEKSDLITLFHGNIIEKLTSFTTLEMHETDGLPTLACLVCLSQVNMTYVFKQMCEASDLALRQFLLERDLKNEKRTEDFGISELSDVTMEDTKHTDSEYVVVEEINTEAEVSFEEETKSSTNYPRRSTRVHKPNKILVEEYECGSKEIKTAENDNTELKNSGESEYDPVSEESSIDQDDHTSKQLAKHTCCIYCKKLISKLPRHLICKHKNEHEVVEFQKYPVKSAKRMELIGALRKKGNFYYNVYIANTNELLAVRQPRLVVDRKHFPKVPCKKCLGYYSKSKINMHYRKCKQENANIKHIQPEDSSLSTTRMTASASLIKYILSIMRNNPVTREIKSDPLILMYGSELCNRSGIKRRNVRLRVRHQMREIARFLIAVKKANPEITQLLDIFDAKHIDAVSAGIDDVAGYDADANTYRTSTLVQDIGLGIKKCANIIIANCIIKGNDVLKKLMEDFTKKFDVSLAKQLDKVANCKENATNSGNANDMQENDPNTEQKADTTNSAGDSLIAREHNRKWRCIQKESFTNVVLERLVNNVIANRQREQSDTKKRKRDDNGSDSDTSHATSLSSSASLPASLGEEDGKQDIEKKTKRSYQVTKRASRRKKISRRVWRTPERIAVRKHFFGMIESGMLPSRQDVEKCILEEPILCTRTWQQVKTWISNQHRERKKKFAAFTAEGQS